jgi:hypothetical protein
MQRTAVFQLLRIIPFVVAITLVPARAKTLSLTAQSGKSTKVYEYANWRADCSSAPGVVKVATKPQHGVLLPRRESVLIRKSRFVPNTVCARKYISAFVVYYTSKSGFHGTDAFVINVSYPPHAAEVDSFTIMVQ